MVWNLATPDTTREEVPVRQQSDAIRGLRWAAMAIVIALAAVAVVRLTDQSPSARASAETRPEPGFELLAGPGAPRYAESNAPPEVPPPPPLAVSKPRVARPVYNFVPPPAPAPMPAPVLGEPVILGLDEAPAPETLPLEKVVVTLTIPEPEPIHPPVIINHARLHHRDHPALRFVKSVGRVFGFGD